MTTSSDADLDLALSLICASVQTYNAYLAGAAFPRRPLDFITAPPGFTYETFWYGQDVFKKDRKHPRVVFGLLFRRDDDGASLFAFRGTEGFAEWIDDAKVCEGRFRPFAPENGPAVPPGARVEDGFLEIYNSMQHELFELLDRQPAAPLLITGHSLGSALCQLFTLDVAISCPHLAATTYDFAAPRTGNRDFAVFYDALTRERGAPTVRFVNTEDIVPSLPPEALGYRHVGVCRPLCFRDKHHHLIPDYGLRHYADNYFRAVCHALGRRHCACRLERGDTRADLEFCTPDPHRSSCEGH